MRAFVKIKQIIGSHKALADKLGQLEDKVGKHDKEIQAIFLAIKQLIYLEQKPKRPIGFRPNHE